MTQPDESLNFASCGECFESFAEPASFDFHDVVEEVHLHAETEGHRLDVTADQV